MSVSVGIPGDGSPAPILLRPACSTRYPRYRRQRHWIHLAKCLQAQGTIEHLIRYTSCLPSLDGSTTWMLSALSPHVHLDQHTPTTRTAARKPARNPRLIRGWVLGRLCHEEPCRIMQACKPPAYHSHPLGLRRLAPATADIHQVSSYPRPFFPGAMFEFGY